MKSKFLKMFLTLAIVNLALLLSAQVTVSGWVTGSDAPQGLVGANITMVSENDSYQRTTLSSGFFEILNVQGAPDGIQYELTISFEGYQTHSSQRIVRDETLTLGTIELEKDKIPPTNVIATVNQQGTSVQVKWNKPIIPPPGTEQWLHWDSGVSVNGMNIASDYMSIVAARFTAQQLHELDAVGTQITAVRFYPREDGDYTIMVWRGGGGTGTSRYPGELRASEYVQEYTTFRWNEVLLESPVEVLPGQEIWIGYRVLSDEGQIGVDQGPAVNGYGNIIKLHGTNNWWTTTELGGPSVNWNVQAFAGHVRGDTSIPLTYANLDRDISEPVEIGDVVVPAQTLSLALDTEESQNSHASNRRPDNRDSIADKQRDLQGYYLFRYNIWDENNPATWIYLASLPTPQDTVYTDHTWGQVEEGLFKYAVQAVYSDEVLSPPAMSNIVSSIPPFAGGDGSEDNPYVIASATNLNSVRYLLDKHFVLANNINLNVAPYNINEGWKPIGFYENESNNRIFTGSLDGKAYSINGLFINRPNGNNQGLFGYIQNAKVINVKLNNVDITGKNHIGGLVGTSKGNSEIRNSYTNGSITGEDYVAGLVGLNDNDSSIYNSYSMSSVEGNGFVAGLVAVNNGLIRHSYSIGEVTGDNNLGGFIASNTATVQNSYWNTETSGQANSNGGEARNSDEMTYPYAQNTYVNWDFNQAWTQDTSNTNNGYPYHKKPNPVVALNPQPEDEANNVSVYLESLDWTYEVNDNHSNPVGFRVYFNTTGEFGTGEAYAWVPYVQEQENYSASNILPEKLAYLTTYYWTVIPTTADGSRANNRDSALALRNDALDCPVWSFTTGKSENPTVAVSPLPANEVTDISIELDRLGWSYIVNPAYTNPVGFRVYLSNTPTFGEEFSWVNYSQNQTEYFSTDILPGELDYETTYYWKVVPTTTQPGRNDNRQSSGIFRGDAEDIPVWTFTSEEDPTDPNPVAATNPQPQNRSFGVSTRINSVSWDYVVDTAHSNPAGFRVYNLNTTGTFGHTAPYVWVEYVENQVSYSCSQVIEGNLSPMTTYYWRVVPTTIVPTSRSKESRNDDSRYSSEHYRGDAVDVETWRFTTGTVNIEDDLEVPFITKLTANYPNPFNPDTAINFSLAESGDVVIEVYNSRGQRVITLVNDYLEAGYHSVKWNGRDEANSELSSGVYLYRMKNGSYTSTNKMIMMK